MSIKVYDNLSAGDTSSISPLLNKIKLQPFPSFVTYKPDLAYISQKAFQYSRYRNILIVGYGGSNTSFNALYESLYDKTGKYIVEIVNTVDPDELYRIKRRYGPKDTLVIAISKSGNTLGVIETLVYFNDYNAVVVTEENNNPLHSIALKKGYDIIAHPKIGGRFSGRTPTTYFPAKIIGIDIEGVEAGFRNIYASCNERVPIENNLALKLAASCYLMEQRGYTEIYSPFYTPKFKGLSNLMIQLVHESSCKNNLGQTVYTAYAPEAQHHTNQRLFGGRKNAVALFMRVEQFENDKRFLLPPEFLTIGLKDTKVSILEGLPYSYALGFELQGTYENCINKRIPTGLISLERIDAYSMGELIGFLQYFAVYSSYLRGVNPFDQPHVEDSKNITFELTKKFGANRNR